MGIVAPTDDSRAKGLIALSNAADGTFVQLWADPVTHRLLVDNVGGGAGSVTSVSVITANGLAGTVATATTTPAITLSTTITGVLKGNGTAISAAVNSDLPVMTATVGGAVPTPPNNTTTFLRGDGTFATPAGGGTVTAVSIASANGFTGTSSGGTTPALTIATSINAPVLAGNGTAIAGATTTGSGSTVVLATSPTMTSPTVGTQVSTDNSTLAASTAFVATAVANAISGVNPAVAVNVATTAAADTSGLTYNNGVSGIGATLTGSVNTPITIDGVLLNTLGQRLLVKNDTQSPSGAFNGVYSLTVISTVGTAPVFTRALDYDTPSDINNTGAIPVVSGTANTSTSWLLTSSVVTVGTSPLTYTQFSLNPTTLVTLAGTQTLTNKDLNSSKIGGISFAGVTGTNNVVFSNSPTLSTPTLGAATATTINGNTFTTGTYTLTGTAAKTLNFTNTLTLSGTDGTTMTFPSTTATVARTDAAQTFTGTQTFAQIVTTNNAITATSNAATVPITSRISTVTNSSAATLTITITTASAVDGMMVMVRVLDFSAVAQTITWVNTENSTVTVPATSNGSTTLPLTVGFQFNANTTKWRCIASA